MALANLLPSFLSELKSGSRHGRAGFAEAFERLEAKASFMRLFTETVGKDKLKKKQKRHDSRRLPLERQVWKLFSCKTLLRSRWTMFFAAGRVGLFARGPAVRELEKRQIRGLGSAVFYFVPKKEAGRIAGCTVEGGRHYG